MILWFGTLSVLGAIAIAKNPGVFAALNPVHGARFLATSGHKGFLVLGSVVLCVTGGEALYADMGHFGAKPIRVAWLGVVMPALVINYFGQGANVLMTPPEVVASPSFSPFYALVPRVLLYPMVLLAAAAAVIASQAMISGAFSLTRQAVQLGYCLRRSTRGRSTSPRSTTRSCSLAWRSSSASSLRTSSRRPTASP
jgi:KUP system potassium uptake protein